MYTEFDEDSLNILVSIMMERWHSDTLMDVHYNYIDISSATCWQAIIIVFYGCSSVIQ